MEINLRLIESSVEFSGQKNLTVLGLGSNKGDSIGILQEAVVCLKDVLGEVLQAPVYRSAALYVTEQADFFNTAVCGVYEKTPYDLLKIIHQIEARFGRDRRYERRWGERTLDIDILLFGDLWVKEEPVLEIPHPRLKERRFALAPLLDILPDAKDPLTGQPYGIFLEKVISQGLWPAGC
ncbi:MAG: 2-amino-4-hydroxy-6-hydroxymethyldihydropteridine diphosphokinase [Treponema sp.]|nr:2-amino-4-hydroxy-6-hydroxymethyldihydropteridine diphosphokinase [Treponema sp.]